MLEGLSDWTTEFVETILESSFCFFPVMFVKSCK